MIVCLCWVERMVQIQTWCFNRFLNNARWSQPFHQSLPIINLKSSTQSKQHIRPHKIISKRGNCCRCWLDPCLWNNFKSMDSKSTNETMLLQKGTVIHMGQDNQFLSPSSPQESGLWLKLMRLCLMSFYQNTRMRPLIEQLKKWQCDTLKVILCFVSCVFDGEMTIVCLSLLCMNIRVLQFVVQAIQSNIRFAFLPVNFTQSHLHTSNVEGERVICVITVRMRHLWKSNWFKQKQTNNHSLNQNKTQL